MTNRQYEHLGRALVAEARLESASQALDDLRSELAQHLSAVAPESADVKGWVKNLYGQMFAEYHGARDFMNSIRSILDVMGKKVCGTCALFYANGHCHKDPKNPVIMRSGEPACADYHSRSACNNGDCERHNLGAELPSVNRGAWQSARNREKMEE